MKKLLFSVVLACEIVAMIATNSAAQVKPDDTLGSESSTSTINVEINGLTSDLIEGGATREQTLFHSFESFNIEAGRGAYFSSPAGIDLILSRVTGGSSSRIAGRLGVLGNADLFFLNPSGVIFSPNASLDLRGSFLVTTANGFIFDDKSAFSSTNPTPVPVLQLSVPIGLQFGQQSASIVNRSRFSRPFPEFDNLELQVGLEVDPRQSFALIGGNILFQRGFLQAPGGMVELGSVTGEGLVSIEKIGSALSFDYSNIMNFRDISLNASQISLRPLANGRVKIQGKDLSVLSGSEVLATDANVLINTSGFIEVSGSEEITPSGAEPFTIFSSIVNETVGVDNGQSTVINTKQLLVRDGGRISTSTTFVLNPLTSELNIAEGKGGDLVINASESVEVLGNNSGLFSVTSSFGDGGSISISTPTLVISDGAQISSSSTGVDPFGNSLATGAGGNIDVIADNITLNNQAFITAQTASNQGGNIQLSVDKLLLLNRNSGISSTAGLGENGGGDITINASIISALPDGNNDITANAFRGPGGLINITTQGIFGFQELTLPQLQALLPGESEPTPDQLISNDITAISQSGDPNLSGQVIFNTPETDPSDSTAELSERIDIPPKLAQSCRPGQALGNGQFANAGKGGLPSTPSSLRSYPAVWHDIRPPSVLQQASTGHQLQQIVPTTKTAPIIEAKGWVTTDKGLMLVAPKNSPLSPALIASGAC